MADGGFDSLMWDNLANAFVRCLSGDIIFVLSSQSLLLGISSELVEYLVRPKAQQFLSQLVAQPCSLFVGPHKAILASLYHVFAVWADNGRLQHQRVTVPTCLYADWSRTSTLESLEKAPFCHASQCSRLMRQYAQELQHFLIAIANLKTQCTLARRIQHAVVCSQVLCDAVPKINALQARSSKDKAIVLTIIIVQLSQSCVEVSPYVHALEMWEVAKSLSLSSYGRSADD